MAVFLQGVTAYQETKTKERDFPAALVSPFRAHLAQRISARRCHMGLLQGQAAELIGVNPNLLSQWERGLTGIPSERLAQIAAAYRTPPGWFFAGAPGLEAAGLMPHLPAVDALILSPEGQTLLARAAGLPADRLESLIRLAEALLPDPDTEEHD